MSSKTDTVDVDVDDALRDASAIVVRALRGLHPHALEPLIGPLTKTIADDLEGRLRLGPMAALKLARYVVTAARAQLGDVLAHWWACGWSVERRDDATLRALALGHVQRVMLGMQWRRIA